MPLSIRMLLMFVEITEVTITKIKQTMLKLRSTSIYQVTQVNMKESNDNQIILPNISIT